MDKHAKLRVETRAGRCGVDSIRLTVRCSERDDRATVDLCHSENCLVARIQIDAGETVHRSLVHAGGRLNPDHFWLRGPSNVVGLLTVTARPRTVAEDLAWQLTSPPSGDRLPSVNDLAAMARALGS